MGYNGFRIIGTIKEYDFRGFNGIGIAGKPMELGLLRRNNGIKIVGDTMELGLLGKQWN